MNRQLRRRTMGVAVGVVAVASLAGATASVPAADLPSVNLPPAPSVPQLPPVPNTPSAPQLPSTPQLEPLSSLPNAPPSVPQAPDLPNPQAPASPRTGPVQGAPAPTAPNGEPASAATPASSATSANSQGSGPGARAASAHGKVRTDSRQSSARRLRKRVERLQGCFYAISGFERHVLRLRAGLGGQGALSRAEVAQRLRVSTTRVRRSERHAFRRLRAADRADGCGRVTLGLHAESGTRMVVAAAQAGPSLQPVGSLASSGESSSGSQAAGRGAVLGRHASSKARRGGVKSALVSAAGDPADGFDGSVFAAIAAGLLFLAGLGLFLLRRPTRRPSGGASYYGPPAGGFAARSRPPAAASPEAAGPAEEPLGSAESESWRWPPRPPRTEAPDSAAGPAPPWPALPEPREDGHRPESPARRPWPAHPPWSDEADRAEEPARQWPTSTAPPPPSEGRTQANGNARRAGLLASGLASLVLGRALGRLLRRR
jgi:hypothetical protein